jgi:hypothetical protein
MKWAGLAGKGNPSALHFLFAPLAFTTKTWDRFSVQPTLFLAKSHVKPFLGFADDQMKRLLGQKGQKNVHRAELEDKHGYDTKYAMHVIRLYGEAKELMEHGRITLPRPNRDELIEIRRGKYSLSEIRELGAQLESEALAAQATSALPDKVNRNQSPPHRSPPSVLERIGNLKRGWAGREECRRGAALAGFAGAGFDLESGSDLRVHLFPSAHYSPFITHFSFPSHQTPTFPPTPSIHSTSRLKFE